ncbi:MAG: hypothetical protein LBM19_00475 [Holosporales bacterium]|nr:hypothetical protein [Holosporales bacterium]
MRKKIILAICTLLVFENSDLFAGTWSRPSSAQNPGNFRIQRLGAQTFNTNPAASASGVGGISGAFDKAREFLGGVKQTVNEAAATAGELQKTQAQIQRQYRSTRDDFKGEKGKDEKAALYAQLEQNEREAKALKAKLKELEKRKREIRQEIRNGEETEAQRLEYEQQKEMKRLRASKAMQEMKRKRQQREDEQRLKTLERQQSQSKSRTLGRERLRRGY